MEVWQVSLFLCENLSSPVINFSKPFPGFALLVHVQEEISILKHYFRNCPLQGFRVATEASTQRLIRFGMFGPNVSSFHRIFIESVFPFFFFFLNNGCFSFSIMISNLSQALYGLLDSTIYLETVSRISGIRRPWRAHDVFGSRSRSLSKLLWLGLLLPRLWISWYFIHKCITEGSGVITCHRISNLMSEFPNIVENGSSFF